MARIRSISPDMRVSEKCAAWPREVRYAFALLWGYCDDYGRGLDNAKIIAADCFPLDDDVTPDVMAGWLDLFAEAGSICRYEHDGKRYLHCLNWREFQKPQHPGKVRIPPCPAHEPAPFQRWCADHGRSSGNPHEGLVSPSPTRGRGRGSKELSKESSEEKEGEPPGGSPPPRFPEHCDEHANDPTPPNCGRCKDARKAWESRPRLSIVATVPATRPHCGECDETRHRATPFGVIRCPACHPLAEEAS